ncbi:MAG: HAMP domain-containing histidine kinase [Planctomycetes bacterium]|nr:HAMP domain-containing histidine kinase [Planctomycetota bacterium]
MSRRIGPTLAFSAALLVPGLLTAAWAWLVVGGVLADLRTEEGAARAAAEERAETLTRARLSAAAAARAPGVVPLASFVPWLDPEPEAEAAAEALLRGARLRAALGDLTGARVLLARQREAADAPRTAPVAFPLLAALVDASLAAEAGDLAPAGALAAAVAAGRHPVPAEAAAPLAELLHELDPQAPPALLRDWCAAAASTRLAPRPWGDAAEGGRFVPGPAGLHVAGPHALAEARRAARAEAFADLPEPPRSVVLERLAGVLLVLAAAAFVAGNLLAWRLLRREAALAEAQAEFVDVMAHELRTPLQALALRTEILAGGAEPPGRHGEYLQAAHHEVQRLIALVHRILDFSRLAKGRSALRPAPVAARAFLARCVREARAALRLRRQRLRVEAARDLGVLHLDADLLAQAVRNLLENAAKFSPEGSEVLLRAVVRGDELHVVVADRGPGVAKTERRAIFAPFRRGRGATATPGSGLGLAIVARAVRAHRGRVRVEAHAGGGAEFHLRVPVRGGAA